MSVRDDDGELLEPGRDSGTRRAAYVPVAQCIGLVVASLPCVFVKGLEREIW